MAAKRAGKPVGNGSQHNNAKGASVMTSSGVTDVAGTYFEAWKAGDFERVRSVLADDATFDGPLGAC
jgi:hypothetical protein